MQSSDGGLITAWSNELKVKTETDDIDSPSSESGGSTAVYDGGDSGQLHQRRQRSASYPAVSDKEQPIRDVGSNFLPLSRDARDEASESKATTWREQSLSGEDRPLEIGTEDGSQLENKILAALKASTERHGRRFLPFNQMDKIFTFEAILEELQTQFRGGTQADLTRLAHQVHDEIDLPGSSLTTRRKIFGTLVRINKVAWITHFVDEDLYDSDLPFSFPSSNEHHEPVTRRSKKGNGEAIPFPRCKQIERESFEQCQWEFQAPFFKVSPTKGQRRRPPHYSLSNKTILPFTEDFEGEGMGDMISAGYSEVWRVRIHRSHHNHPSVSHDPPQEPAISLTVKLMELVQT